jgi:polyphosphate glucokinase
LKVAPPAEADSRTLCIDIGGTGLKVVVLGPKGEILSDRVRVETPRPAKPKKVIHALWKMIETRGAFDRISAGFPGVVVDGVVKTAPNLHPDWEGFPLGQTLADAARRPVRVLNDAGVQGYGVVEGSGVEMLITLGTGMGAALFMEGVYVPNLELAHHPFHKNKTYEDYVGVRALEKVGRKEWSKRVHQVVEQILPIWNPRVLYVGGGNARHVKGKLPPEVKLVPNFAGLLGGVALWRNTPDVFAVPQTHSQT